MTQAVDPRVAEMVKECAREAEACNYTATTLYIWQKYAKWWRAVFIIAPIILAAIASTQLIWKLFAKDTIPVLSGLLAGFFPAIYVSLNLDMHVAAVGRAASEFTNLRDRFRQAGNIKSLGDFDEFRAEFEALMDRFDAARASAPTAPDWCFRMAQRKIHAGDYTYDADDVTPYRSKRPKR